MLTFFGFFHAQSQGLTCNGAKLGQHLFRNLGDALLFQGLLDRLKK
jgi:hypothetical protein